MPHRTFGKSNVDIIRVLTTKFMSDKDHSCDKIIFRNVNAKVVVHNNFKGTLEAAFNSSAHPLQDSNYQPFCLDRYPHAFHKTISYASLLMSKFYKSDTKMCC